MKFSSSFLTGLMTFGLIISSCDIPTGNDSKSNDTLYVKFLNSSSSQFVITDIQLIAMGRADSENSTPIGEWSNNILPDGKTLAPGEYEFFTLDIPIRTLVNTDWV